LRIPSAVHSIRRSLGLTQEQFGRLLLVKRITIARWEQGKKSPSLRSLLFLQAKANDQNIKAILHDAIATMVPTDTIQEMGPSRNDRVP
jgi:transcriptional regulator with XRE-family HTH domain